MTLPEICDLPVEASVADTAHLDLWVPNALLPEGLKIMENWGFASKSNIIWYKIRKDGGPDRRGVGFYFRNVTEVLLVGVRGKNARTLQQGRTKENIISAQKREHSCKSDEQDSLIEGSSSRSRLELFSRGPRVGWTVWGNQADAYAPTWDSYANHSPSNVVPMPAGKLA